MRPFEVWEWNYPHVWCIWSSISFILFSVSMNNFLPIIFLIMEPFLCMLLVFLFTLVWQVCLKFFYEIFSNFIVLSVKIFFLVVHFVGWLFYFKVNSNRSDCPILVPIWFSFLEPKSTKPNCNFFATFSRWTPSNFRFCVFCPKTWKNTFSR